MRRSHVSRRARSFVAMMCLVLGVTLVPAANVVATPGCDAQVNDTPSKLVPCIQTDDLWTTWRTFQAIADANPGPRRPPVAQLGRAGLQGVGGLRREGDDGRRLRRHDPAVQVHLLRVHGIADVQRGLADRATTFGLGDDWNPGQSTGTATRRPAAGRRHRHPADADLELDERLHGGRLQRLHAGHGSR